MREFVKYLKYSGIFIGKPRIRSLRNQFKGGREYLDHNLISYHFLSVAGLTVDVAD